MNRICLVVLIGLPGVGKTTVCRYFMQMETLPYNILHFCYDNLINFNTESLIQYKEQRKNIFKLLKEIVTQFKNFKSLPKELRTNVQYKRHQKSDLIILCDDNHYYSSMRYKLFQLAREENIGYCQIYFDCNTQLALERNALRCASSKLPNEVILQMCSRLEVPNVCKHQWEKNTLITKSLLKSYDEIISFVTQFLDKPVQPLHVNIPITSNSKIHELDLLLRKRINMLMSDKQNKSKLQAYTLNEKRKEILGLFQRDMGDRSFDNVDLSKYTNLLTNI